MNKQLKKYLLLAWDSLFSGGFMLLGGAAMFMFVQWLDWLELLFRVFSLGFLLGAIRQSFKGNEMKELINLGWSIVCLLSAVALT